MHSIFRAAQLTSTADTTTLGWVRPPVTYTTPAHNTGHSSGPHIRNHMTHFACHTRCAAPAAFSSLQVFHDGDCGRCLIAATVLTQRLHLSIKSVTATTHLQSR